MTEKGVILFHTTAAVMRAEKLLLQQGLKIKLVPPPRQFSSDCGISIQFQIDDRDRVVEILNSANVEIDAVHQL
jgi:hypothetical protein